MSEEKTKNENLIKSNESLGFSSWVDVEKDADVLRNADAMMEDRSDSPPSPMSVKSRATPTSFASGFR